MCCVFLIIMKAAIRTCKVEKFMVGINSEAEAHETRILLEISQLKKQIACVEE